MYLTQCEPASDLLTQVFASHVPASLCTVHAFCEVRICFVSHDSLRRGLHACLTRCALQMRDEMRMIRDGRMGRDTRAS